MELSRRLQAVADLVTVGYKTADIGTDHAYIPIYLVESGRIPSAIAMDINDGPLERARNHVMEHGLSQTIELRLSNGLASLSPKEADTAVIAGMGGGLVMRILKNDWKVTLTLKECILQPQSEIAKVRAFLLEEGFLFIQEDMVLEDGKFYPMMKVAPPCPDQVPMISKDIGVEWSMAELRYGKLLLESRHPVLRHFLEKEINLKTRIIENLKEQGTSHAKQRMKELEQELEYAQKGMEYYAL